MIWGFSSTINTTRFLHHHYRLPGEEQDFFAKRTESGATSTSYFLCGLCWVYSKLNDTFQRSGEERDAKVGTGKENEGNR